MTACILCARRGRTTELDTGHVCAVCATRIGDDLAAIPRLAAQASTEPRTGRGSGRTVPASRPPIDLAGIDPALTTVLVGSGPTTVLEAVESWTRVVREERGLSPYGPWSAEMARAASPAGRRAANTPTPVSQDPRQSQAVYGPHATTVTLIAVCEFLRAHHDWVIAQPWVDDYADEIRACARALRHLDPEREPAATVVPCPTTSVDHGDCGQRLRLDSDHVRCSRCGRDWDREMLVRAATSIPQAADLWVDVLAASAATGVPARTIQRWARLTYVRRQQGRYSVADVKRHAESSGHGAVAESDHGA